MMLFERLSSFQPSAADRDEVHALVDHVGECIHIMRVLAFSHASATAPSRVG
jgi:hypothetical protein